MNPQSEDRSIDSRPRGGSYGGRGAQPKRSLETSNQHQQNDGYNYGVPDVQRQRFMSPAVRDGQTSNSSQPPSPIEARNGEREGSFNLPIRERPRTDSNIGANRQSKPQNGNLRICLKCNDPLTGQFVRALGATFHLECFKCQVSEASP